MMVESSSGHAEDVDRSDLPDWWRQAIEEFEEFGLPEYKPSRFQDGAITHTVVSELEEEFDIDILLIGVNVSHGDDWTVRVDSEDIGTIPRTRSKKGYTVFEMESDAFVSWVRDNIDDR